MAQATATIHGTVLDASSASIPEARVTATNLGSNQSRSVSTDEAGRYTWGVGGSRVQSGRFHVRVEVVSEQPDSATGRAGCDWEFDMQVSMP